MLYKHETLFIIQFDGYAMVKIEIEFDLKNYRFSNELITGVKKPPENQEKIKIAHFIYNWDFDILSETEIKVKFSFKLIITPDIGTYKFDGGCILESPSQERIRHLLEKYPAKLKQVIDKSLLKECYFYSEKLAQSEQYYFPNTQKILAVYRIE